MEEQERNLRQKIDVVYSDVKNMQSYIHNIKCKNPDVVVKLAPILTSSIVVNVPELVELLIDDLLEEEVHNLNLLEEIDQENSQLVETMIKKNRVKTKIQNSAQYGVWQMIESLETVKNEFCEE